MMSTAAPTNMTGIPPTEWEKQNYLASYVDVGMNLQDVTSALAQMHWKTPKTQTNGRCNHLLNICGKISHMGEPKSVTAAGKKRNVVALELVDETQNKVEIKVWDEACKFRKDIPVGEGVTLIRCTATREGNIDATKINMWDSVRVLPGGVRAQFPTSLSLDRNDCQALTAKFTPASQSLPSMDTPGLPLCAAALTDVPALSDDKIIQINRCVIDAPTQEANMFARNGEGLHAKCRIRDWSGGAEVEIVNTAMPELYGRTDAQGVKQALNQGNLMPKTERVNVRGVMMPGEGGVVRTFIGKITDSPLDAVVSGKAMRASLGLSEVTGDVVMAVPADRALDAPILGLAARSDRKGVNGAHRVLLLAKGTEESKLEPPNASQSLIDQSFRISSKKVKSLSSDNGISMDLHGYCDLGSMLQYRLDKDVSLALASAVETAATPGENDARAIEHMMKIGDVPPLKAALEEEWKTALTNHHAEPTDKHMSPQQLAYWERPAKITPHGVGANGLARTRASCQSLIACASWQHEALDVSSRWMARLHV
jgi:hypothetical protein